VSETGPSLSALIVVHNEEVQLADCLELLRFADQIVVVLDRCTDGSKEIAEGFGADIIEGRWPLEGDRRNTGIDGCRSEWVLEVDADERVSTALAQEIRSVIGQGDRRNYLLPFDNYVGSRLIKYGWGGAWGVSATVRLFEKGAKRWGRERVHPHVDVHGPQGLLVHPMVHYVDRDISDMLRRLDRYTTARAADLRESGDIGSLRANVRRIFSRFWKCYVARRGYREGPYGFLIALMAGLYPVLSHLKARLEDG